MANLNINPKLPLRILSVDGGGVRGIVPARILKEFETRTGKPISDSFDLMVGTSTGGIIVLGLNVPDEQNKPHYTANDILQFYLQKSPLIFKRTLLRKILTGWGLWKARYNRKNYGLILKNLFKNYTLSQALKPISIVSYSIDKGLPQIWDRENARQNPARDFYLYEIAEATSAAPTYFSPKELKDKNGQVSYEIDGGVYANNPESIAVAAAFRLFPTLTHQDIVVVSIGTGKVTLTQSGKKLKDAGLIGWLLKDNLLDVMLSAESEWFDEEVSHLYQHSYRLEINLNKTLFTLDNAQPDILNRLLEMTEDYIFQQNDRINDILKIVNNPSL